MKKLIWILVFCMALTACAKPENVHNVTEKQPETSFERPSEDELPMEEMEFFETKYQWVDSENTDEEFRSLTQDYVEAIFREAYTNCRIESYTFSNAEQRDLLGGDMALKFDFEFVYSPYPEVSSQSALDPAETVNLKLRILAEKEYVHYEADSFKCYAIEIDEGIATTWPIFEKIPEPNTFLGEIEFEDGRVELERKIWVQEKGGYTNNGFFIADTDIEYRFDVAENCTVAYNKTADFVDSMAIKDFMALDDTDDRLYLVTFDETYTVTDIIEVYRP